MSIPQQPGQRALAVFIDFENLALGFKDRQGRFDIKLVLKRLLEQGKIVAKRAYADWSRFGTYTGSLHESAIELIEIPKRSQTGKNSADIRLCVDAMDLAYSKDHIDTFVIVSGDSDFSPLVSKLKELGKHVIGLGMVDSTSALLRDNCDEFIYYEDLSQPPTKVALRAGVTENKQNAFTLLFEALVALRRNNREILGASHIKDTIRRVHPSFIESQYGYRSFSALLQDAQKEGMLELGVNQKAGTLVVTRFGDELKTSAAPTADIPVAPQSPPPAATTMPAASTTVTATIPSVAAAKPTRLPPRVVRQPQSGQVTTPVTLTASASAQPVKTEPTGEEAAALEPEQLEQPEPTNKPKRRPARRRKPAAAKKD